MTSPPRMFLVLAFLVVIGFVLPLQVIVEVSAGERPGIVQLFERVPSQANLRAFERDLESRSVVVGGIRPWMQLLDYTLLGDAGDKALLGRDGWWFYRPGVQYLTQAWVPEREDAGSAIRSFHDQLAERGIRLLVVPVPGKASIYADRLTARAAALTAPPNAHTQALLAELRRDGIEVIDLTALFWAAREGAAELYLRQDTHWSPRGVDLAAEAIAERILELGWVSPGDMEYQVREVSRQRHGDLVGMMDAPPLAVRLPVEETRCRQVVADGIPYTDDPTSEVLVLGDSFLRIYRDDPGAAGLIAELARELGFPLSALVNDGGASTLVRQQLSQRPEWLQGKRVVIWQFVERDIRFGVEGWQDVQLR